MDKESIIQKPKQVKVLAESCITELSSKEKVKRKPDRKLPGTTAAIPTKSDFDMSERAFIKKYSKRISGGPKKFVLILAYLVKGEIGKEKSIEEIKKHWNKMTSLLKKKGEKGEFNSYYSITAKDNNWVDSKKHGFFHLTNDWTKIFSKK